MSDPILDRFHSLTDKPREKFIQPEPEEPLDDEEYGKPIEMFLGNQLVQFYQIGTFARILNRKPVTIRSWEDKGVIPLSPWRMPAPSRMAIGEKTNKGRRIYTRTQIDVVLAAAKRTGVYDNKLDADWKGFTSAVLFGWRQHKIQLQQGRIAR